MVSFSPLFFLSFFPSIVCSVSFPYFFLFIFFLFFGKYLLMSYFCFEVFYFLPNNGWYLTFIKKKILDLFIYLFSQITFFFLLLVFFFLNIFNFCQSILLSKKKKERNSWHFLWSCLCCVSLVCWDAEKLGAAFTTGVCGFFFF